MTKNKIIFSVLGLILLLVIVFVVMKLGNFDPNEGKDTTPRSENFNVWILQDDVSVFNSFLDTFRAAYPEYANQTIQVESFSDEISYTNTLVSAISKWLWPDIFLLNNSEVSILSDQAEWISANTISPNDFRLRFKPVFWTDLIVADPADTTVEYIKWIPMWYEALGIFYNRKYFIKPSELQTWEDVLLEIKNISEKFNDIIPIALWNASWVTHAADIMKAFFVLEGESSLASIDSAQSRQGLSLYTAFGDRNSDNKYNTISAPLFTESDIEFFTQWDVAAMVWYPRDLIAIDKIGYQKNFLFATPFPGYSGKELKTMIDYNYFILNKDSPNKAISNALLTYMASPEGQSAYIEKFPYYLPADSNLEQSYLERKILWDYNIIYKNFIPDISTHVSFNVGDRRLFSSEMNRILDAESWYDSRFETLKSFIVCTTTKHVTLLNLSSPCANVK